MLKMKLCDTLILYKKKLLKQKTIYCISILSIIWSILLYRDLALTSSIEERSQDGAHTSPTVSSGCIVNHTLDTVRGMSMEPMLSSGDELSVLDGYYRCGGVISRGDIVIIEDTATRGPYVKRVRALPGDTIHIATGGTLTIE